MGGPGSLGLQMEKGSSLQPPHLSEQRHSRQSIPHLRIPPAPAHGQSSTSLHAPPSVFVSYCCHNI